MLSRCNFPQSPKAGAEAEIEFSMQGRPEEKLLQILNPRTRHGGAKVQVIDDDRRKRRTRRESFNEVEA